MIIIEKRGELDSVTDTVLHTGEIRSAGNSCNPREQFFIQNREVGEREGRGLVMVLPSLQQQGLSLMH